jgi:urea transporter
MAINSWVNLANNNPVAGFVDLSLRGASQVFFQNNPLTGLMMLAAVFWGSYANENLSVGWGAVLGLVVSSFTAMLLRVDRESLRQGLYGFNGVLVGAALPTFLSHPPALWAYVVIGAAASTIFTLALANVVKTWQVPGSTAPFVFTTWLLLLAAYSFARIPAAAMGPAVLPTPTGTTDIQLSGSIIASILAKNVSQVYLVENVVTGILFLVAIAVSSVRSAIFAVAGSVVSLATTVLLGASGSSVRAGLYGFSAVLTAIAVGAVFNTPSTRVTLYALFATLFTVIAQAALNAALSPVGIPTLTFPYVLTMWIFLLPKANLEPMAHHQPVADGVLNKS